MPVTLGLLAMQVVWQYPLAILIIDDQVPLPLLVLLSTIPDAFSSGVRASQSLNYASLDKQRQSLGAWLGGKSGYT